jgi:hypothetical protein
MASRLIGSFGLTDWKSLGGKKWREIFGKDLAGKNGGKLFGKVLAGNFSEKIRFDFSQLNKNFDSFKSGQLASSIRGPGKTTYIVSARFRYRNDYIWQAILT